jgi:hypothetical protein
MLSEVVSLTRLRFYERECRQQAGTATDSVSRAELSRFGETFQRAITRLESKLDDFEARRGTHAPVDCSRCRSRWVSAAHATTRCLENYPLALELVMR